MFVRNMKSAKCMSYHFTWLQSYYYSHLILSFRCTQTLYDYEVAIYAELNGSNEWNGSVLAVMLVAGTVGALLPTWLKHDVYDSSGGGGSGGRGSGGGRASAAVGLRLRSMQPSKVEQKVCN